MFDFLSAIFGLLSDMLDFLSAIFCFVSALLVEDLFFSIYFGSSNSFLLYDCENIVSFDI